MIDASKQVLVMFLAGLFGGYFYGTHKVEEEMKGPATQLEGVDNRNCKMVFVIRSDLPLPAGKLAEQCAQACLGCYEIAVAKALTQLRAWKQQGQAKITLKCKGGPDEILMLQRKADHLGLVTRVIVDPQGGISVLGIGPAPSSVINMVTGELSLY